MFHYSSRPSKADIAHDFVSLLDLPKMSARQILLLRVYQCLRDNCWNRTRAAKELDCETRTLRNWISEIKTEIGVDIPDSPFQSKSE